MYKKHVKLRRKRNAFQSLKCVSFPNRNRAFEIQTRLNVYKT
jgi:hypothetical protein